MKRIAKYILLFVAIIWLSGSAFALYEVRPNGCTAPFKVWALTWPIFKIAPDSVRLWMVMQSFKLCDEGK